MRTPSVGADGKSVDLRTQSVDLRTQSLGFVTRIAGFPISPGQIATASTPFSIADPEIAIPDGAFKGRDGSPGRPKR